MLKPMRSSGSTFIRCATSAVVKASLRFAVPDARIFSASRTGLRRTRSLACLLYTSQFTAEGKLIEAQRIAQRTNYDIEMLNEVGMCKGIENYSAVLSGRKPGSMPTTLLDYFPDDFLLFVRCV